VSCLSETISPPGTLSRDGVDLEFKLGQPPFSSDNEKIWFYIDYMRLLQKCVSIHTNSQNFYVEYQGMIKYICLKKILEHEEKFFKAQI